MKTVPVLLTYDIHTHAAHSPSDVDRYLQHTLELHARMEMKASFFFPAESARAMKATVAALVREGHAIGCHGLTHRNESYKSMPPAEQREKLTRATREIEDVVQQRVTFFRAPVFKISGATIRILEELGYEADLSMNSQRLGVLSSDVWNLSWMLAPRLPYHPDLRHPWRKGRLKIWEIPLSCIGLPFMSNTALVVGLGVMQGFLRVLLGEARWSGKPVVYMAHPEDLCGQRPAEEQPRKRWSDLVPNRGQGVRARHWLFESNPKTIARMSESLLKSIRESQHLTFCTVPEYVAALSE